MSAQDVEDELEELVREQANNQCEECETDENLDIYQTNDQDGSFSLDALTLLCSECYYDHYTDTEVTPDQVLDLLGEIRLPFLTSSRVRDELSCSSETARKRLNTLVDRADLERYDLGGRRTLYFIPDYREGTEVLSSLREHIDLSDLDPDALQAFAEQPYKIIPKSETEYYVVVPKWLPLQIGHLHEQDSAWQVFIVNKYVSWITDLPDQIQNKVDIKESFDTAKVDGQVLTLDDEAERERAWEELGGREGGLNKRVDDDKIRIQKGAEFDVIASLIDGGNLPFTPHPIEDDDLRAEPPGVTLRSYQEEAWDQFEQYGQVGVFLPPGAGKTYFSLYAGDRIDGKKLVVVPTTTLQSQWNERINDVARDPDEWQVATYQYLTQNGDLPDDVTGDNSPRLTIYDECHTLPADTFSKIAMHDTEYRIGLSASPYREDGRSDYIFALTGVPVGINWQELVAEGVVRYPSVWVYLYKTRNQKRDDLLEIAREKPGKGLIFCDSLEDGQEIADELNAPFVSGDTPEDERIETVQNNRVVVASRVADEGLSIDNLDWSIEFDFQGGSRRQELQRTGRLMHSDSDDRQHIVMMTDRELDDHGQRLYSLEEQGMEITYERRA